MAIPESSSEKSRLRDNMRQLFSELDADSSETLKALNEWLHQHPPILTIAVYSALPGEVDLLQTVLQYSDRRWVYPRVQGLELHFHEVKNPAADLIPGAFRIPEPREELPEVPIDQIDAFLCPGLAFDPNGGRLGRGRGFYDRILVRSRPDALKIGICRKVQMVADTFSEPHDIFMDEVISR